MQQPQKPVPWWRKILAVVVPIAKAEAGARIGVPLEASIRDQLWNRMGLDGHPELRPATIAEIRSMYDRGFDEFVGKLLP